MTVKEFAAEVSSSVVNADIEVVAETVGQIALGFLTCIGVVAVIALAVVGAAVWTIFRSVDKFK